MDEVVVDATVLIFLGKLRKLAWLRDAYSTVLVPGEVYEEVVVQGKEVGAKDAGLVEAAVEDGWIEVVVIEPSAAVARYDLEAGETEVLSLAMERDHELVLADEESVREVARLHGIRPRGTLHVLFEALEGERITFEEFLELLEELLDHGFYLDQDVYLEAVRRARELSE